MKYANISKSTRVIIVFLILAAFFLVVLRKSQEPIDWSRIRLDPLWTGLSILICVGHQLLASMLWWKVLSGTGISVRASTAVYAYLVGDLGKYVPGKIWAIAGRAAILSKEGVSYPAAITASALEILLTIASGIIVGMIYFFLKTSGSIISQFHMIALFLAAAFLLMAVYPTTQTFLLRLLGSVINYRHPINALSARSAIALFILYSGLWIFSGFLHICIFTSISSESAPDLLTMSSIVALSTTLGIMAIFAPGGLGVREALIVSLLLPFVPIEVSAVFALLSRFIVTASQGLVTVVAASIYSYAGHRDGAAPAARSIRAEDSP